MEAGRTNLFLMAALGLLLLVGPVWAMDGSEPISYWNFDEGSGTTAYDSVGTNHGTVYDANWITGRVGSALSFDGDADYVDVGDKTSLDFGTSTDFTISLWFKMSTAETDMIVNKRAKGYEPGYDLYMHGGKIHARISDSSSVISAVTGETYNDDSWYHLAAIYDRDDRIKMYIDGDFVSESASISGIDDVNNNEPFMIGRRADPVSHLYFDGLIDEVMIFNRALSEKDIELLYLEGFSGSELGIMAIESAIGQKLEALDAIDAALAREWMAYDALEELLASGDYGDLSKRDIAAAQREIESAIRRQERSRKVAVESIEELEDALLSLGWEPEP